MNQNNIKPQELRIGNWVQYNGVNYQIDSITTKGTWISTEKGMDSVRWEEVFPIPLSEKVLLKLGFEKTPNHENLYFITLNDWTKIYVSFFEDRFAVELSVSKHSFCPRVNSLHQLQNLFYSLTQTELEVRWT